MVCIFLNCFKFAVNMMLMKILKQVVLFIGLFCFAGLSAQQVVKTDTLSGNPLTTTMDQKINDLLQSAEDKCSMAGKSPDSGEDNYTTSTKIAVPERTMSRAEICRKYPRIMGYKIQIVVVKSNDEANKVITYFRSKFPDLKAIRDASLRPNYKVLVGSYFSKEAAQKDLARIKGTFKEAVPVKYYIFCVEGKD